MLVNEILSGKLGVSLMNSPVELRLYASHCARNDFYLDRIRRFAAELGLVCSAEKITDEAVIEALGFDDACQPSYCPGCRANHMYPADQPRLPVLTANGVPLFWDVPPSDEQLRSALKAYL